MSDSREGLYRLSPLGIDSEGVSLSGGAEGDVACRDGGRSTVTVEDRGRSMRCCSEGLVRQSDWMERSEDVAGLFVAGSLVVAT